MISLGSPSANHEVNLESDEVMAFVHLEQMPNYKVLLSGVTGNTLTIPSYTIGNSLLVFRNGLLMNNSSIGTLDEQYTEASSTTLGLLEDAEADEIFTILYLPSYQWRQDITNVTSDEVNLINSYTIGTDRLLVFRNGKLMYKSLTLGTLEDRYSQATSMSLILEEDATDDESFSVIYL
jgi:hypothetical protein